MAGRKTRPVGEQDETYIDLQTFTKYFGCNPATAKKWRDQGMPSRAVGANFDYPVSRCIHWRIEQQQARTAKEEGSPDLNAAKVRNQLALAELNEHKLAEAKGQTVDVEYASKCLAVILAAIMATIKSSEQKYTALIHGHPTLPETQAAVTTAFNEMLTECQQTATEGSNAFTNKFTGETGP